ncbi:MAG: ATP-grasp domain-containing protein [Verrucomicrobiales bacterium]|nr:ATP-grasp domain-containing protein [Verrucomicrobiales bacterium]
MATIDSHTLERFRLERLNVLIVDCDDDLCLKVARGLGSVEGVRIWGTNSKRPNAWLRVSKHIRSCRPLKADESFWQETLQHLVAEHEIDVVVPTKLASMKKLEELHGDRIGRAAIHPVPSRRAQEVANDKWQLSRFADEIGVRTPKTVLHSENCDFQEELRELDGPWIAKPIFGAWGRSIYSFDTLSKLERFLTHEADPCIPYEVQEYIHGTDIDCSVLCRDGVIQAYTIQEAEIPNPVAFKPAKVVKFTHDKEVLRMVSLLMRRLNWDGIAHVDLRRCDANGSIYLIEINGRYWGSLLGSLSAGVNFPFLACVSALGHSFDCPSYRLIRYAGIDQALQRFLPMRSKAGHSSKVKLKETAWQYTLRDPLPELFRQLSRVFQTATKTFRHG